MYGHLALEYQLDICIIICHAILFVSGAHNDVCAPVCIKYMNGLSEILFSALHWVYPSGRSPVRVRDAVSSGSGDPGLRPDAWANRRPSVWP